MIVLNSYSGYKYNIFFRLNSLESKTKDIHMGTINITSDELFSVDLYNETNVFKFRTLTECLEFFEGINLIFKSRINTKHYDIVDNVFTEGSAYTTLILDKRSYLGDITNDYLKPSFNLYEFRVSLVDEKDTEEFLKTYKNYLKTFSEKVAAIYV